MSKAALSSHPDWGTHLQSVCVWKTYVRKMVISPVMAMAYIPDEKVNFPLHYVVKPAKAWKQQAELFENRVCEDLHSLAHWLHHWGAVHGITASLFLLPSLLWLLLPALISSYVAGLRACHSKTLKDVGTNYAWTYPATKLRLQWISPSSSPRIS